MATENTYRIGDIEFYGTYEDGDANITGLWFPEGFNPADYTMIKESQMSGYGFTIEEFFLVNLRNISTTNSTLFDQMVQEMADKE